MHCGYKFLAVYQGILSQFHPLPDDNPCMTFSHLIKVPRDKQKLVLLTVKLIFYWFCDIQSDAINTCKSVVVKCTKMCCLQLLISSHNSPEDINNLWQELQQEKARLKHQHEHFQEFMQGAYDEVTSIEFLLTISLLD